MSIIIENVTGGNVEKALTTTYGTSFQMNDVTDVVERRPLRPGLLTALMTGSITRLYLNTTVFEYDETNFNSVIPTGKSYTEKGKDVPKSPATVRYFRVPSFGLTARVAPADWANKRAPGTTRLMREEDLRAEMVIKMQDAWDILDEIGIAQLLTTDTNYVGPGSPHTSYNFYTDIVGTTRPAATYVDLDGTPAEPVEVTIRNQVNILTQEVGRSFDRLGAVVAVCGTEFFSKRYEIEKNEGLARDIRFGLDLATMPINTSYFGGSPVYPYQWFTSFDGITYINYGSASIDGTNPLIPTDMAILIPLGSRNIIREVYAPAQTRTYANTQAIAMYSWERSDEFAGLFMAQESNKLFSSINPRAIRVLTSTAPG
jgi:hypothetical protein